MYYRFKICLVVAAADARQIQRTNSRIFDDFCLTSPQHQESDRKLTGYNNCYRVRNLGVYRVFFISSHSTRVPEVRDLGKDIQHSVH